jgi:hypothetical protein
MVENEEELARKEMDLEGTTLKLIYLTKENESLKEEIQKGLNVSQNNESEEEMI